MTIKHQQLTTCHTFLLNMLYTIQHNFSNQIFIKKEIQNKQIPIACQIIGYSSVIGVGHRRWSSLTHCRLYICDCKRRKEIKGKN